MKLLIGLGNIGHQYQLTRHNIGFFVIDDLAQAMNVQFAEKSKFRCDIAEGSMNGEKVLLIKPTTFYNESGQAVRAVIDFYKIDTSDVLAIHDELALPFGLIRARIGGSDAGNNGIKSISAHIGDDYARIRIGIDNDLRGRMQDADFVLSKFSEDEQSQLGLLSVHAKTMAEAFVQGRLDAHTVSV